MEINQPPIIGPRGNILVNNRSGLQLTLRFKDSNREPVDMTSHLIFFEVANIRKQLTTVPSVNSSMRLVIQREELDAANIMIGKNYPFVLLDETGTVDIPLWSNILSRGI